MQQHGRSFALRGAVDGGKRAAILNAFQGFTVDHSAFAKESNVCGALRLPNQVG